RHVGDSVQYRICRIPQARLTSSRGNPAMDRGRSSQLGDRVEMGHEKPWKHRSFGPVSWDKFSYAHGRTEWRHRHDTRSLARTISGILPKIPGAEVVILQNPTDGSACQKGGHRLEIFRARADGPIRLIRRADYGDPERRLGGLFPESGCGRV